MIVVDGSQGEGGGQILRSCLSLSMLSGRPLRMEKIRARRQKPGLQPQHATAVMAAQKICGAKVRGAEVGSTTLLFEPGEVKAGDYHLAIGTAGSTTLVMQTLLPPLLHATGRSRLTLEGGTHNPLAPPWDFLAESFLPLLRRMGARVEAKLESFGFYPAGGGRIRAEIEPCRRLGRLELPAVGAERRASARRGGSLPDRTAFRPHPHPDGAARAFPRGEGLAADRPARQRPGPRRPGRLSFFSVRDRSRRS